MPKTKYPNEFPLLTSKEGEFSEQFEKLDKDKNESKEEYYARMLYLSERYPAHPKLIHIVNQGKKRGFITTKRNSRQEFEELRLSRKPPIFEGNWIELSNRYPLSLEDLFSVILRLIDREGRKKLPANNLLLGEIQDGVETGKLVPDLDGVIQWATKQGYKLFESPIHPKRSQQKKNTQEKYEMWQKDAEKLAAIWQSDGRLSITKRKIAQHLATEYDRNENPSTIETRLKKTW